MRLSFCWLLSILALHGMLGAAHAGSRDSAFHEEIILNFKSLLAESPLTEEHLGFTRSPGFAFSFTEIPSLVGSSIARYRGGKILLSQKAWADMRANLVATAVSGDQAAHVLAVKSLPVVVHEIHHGLSARRQREEFGYSYLALHEEEERAYLDAILVLKDLRSRYPTEMAVSIPELDEAYALLDSAWSDGPAGLRRFVRKHYSQPSLRNYAGVPDAQSIWLEGAKRQLDNAREKLESRISLERELLSADPGRRATINRKLEGIYLESTSRERIAMFSELVPILADDAIYAQFLRYHSLRQEEIEGAWRRQESEGLPAVENEALRELLIRAEKPPFD